MSVSDGKEGDQMCEIMCEAEAKAASGEPSTTTILKYEKFSCLYCREWFDSEQFSGHMEKCRQKLVNYPICKPIADNSNLEVTSSEAKLNDELRMDHMQQLEEDMNVLRSLLNEELAQRFHLITEIGHLRRQHLLHNEWSANTDKALELVHKRLDEESSQRHYEVDQCQQDFRCVFDVLQILKSEVYPQLGNLEKEIENSAVTMMENYNNLRDNLAKAEERIISLDPLRDQRLKDLENLMYSLKIHKDANSNAKQDLTSKITVLDVEMKTLKQTISDVEEHHLQLQSWLGQLEAQLHSLKQTVNEVENHLATQQRFNSLINTNGHLIWRINDFHNKLEQAKAYEAVFHSAMFSNKPFGYALRLDIYLNGRGGWKGRNMLARLNVIGGEYDALLAWPCRLQADVIIRDQLASDDYVKTVQIRKRSEDYSHSNLYFHIPHKILMQPNYLNNDCIFVEVKVMKNG